MPLFANKLHCGCYLTGIMAYPCLSKVQETAELICKSSAMCWIMAALPILLVFFPQMAYTMEQSALYRNPTGDFSVSDIRRYSFHYLWAENIERSMVEDQFDCTFLCVAEPKCYSFNMAAYPDSKGLYLCELLATDKYRETKKFLANATFHHYSPWVSDKRILFHNRS